MATFNVPLLELTFDNFPQAWIRFELVSTAKVYNVAKQTVILPTLLQGKLIDHYIGLDDATKADLQLGKTALMEKAGLMQDPLIAVKLFMGHCQHTMIRSQILQ